MKLRELADLLVAKGDTYLPGMASLDTPRALKPMVVKLSANLQKKCLFTGSQLKDALAHPHLKSVGQLISKLDPEAQLLILLGRDMIRVQKARQQIIGPNDAPFAQRLDLGWVIVGDVCIDRAHKPTVSVFKTKIQPNG